MEREEEYYLRQLLDNLDYENNQLTDDEIRELAKKKDEGDLEAKNKLISCNLGLVYSIASKYKYRHQDAEYDELISAGYETLEDAIRKYRWNHESGATLSTYVQNQLELKFKIKWWKEKKSENTGLTLYKIDKVLELRKKRNIFHLDKGRDPSVKELAEMMGTQEEKIEDYLEDEKLFTISSLDKPIGEENDSQTLGDEIMGDDGKSPEDILIDHFVSLKDSGFFEYEALLFLTDREKLVLSKRSKSLLGHNNIVGYKDIAEYLDVSITRVKDIEKRARERIAYKLKEFGISV